MTLSRWISRCVPGLSCVTLLLFIEFVLDNLQAKWLVAFFPLWVGHYVTRNVLLGTLVVYFLILHLTTWKFLIRLCLATQAAANQIEDAHREADRDHVSSVLENTEKSCKNEQELATNHVQVVMAIIIPCYKEDLSTIEDTLSVLGSHVSAKDSYNVYLAMEGRDPNGESIAIELVSAFGDRFMAIQYTVHPAGIPGEAPGKSSNVSWAARKIEEAYTGRPEWEDVLITVMDSDTHLLPHYFKMVRSSHIQNRRSSQLAEMTLYMPPIVFDRNARQVPQLVRVADIMWSSAGLSCFQPEVSPRGIGFPTAVYTISLPLAQLVGGWDADAGAIGEDMHMMLKCYFGTNGSLKIESIPSPASHCNIAADRSEPRLWLAGLIARYHQGLRHMWGCLDTGFAIRQWIAMGRQASASLQAPQKHSISQRTCVVRRNRKLSRTEPCLRLSQSASHQREPARFTWRNLILFARLFEAHFLPAHLFIAIVVSPRLTIMAKTDESLSLARSILDLIFWTQIMSYVTVVACVAVSYERYHRVCVQVRAHEMLKSGLHSQLSDQFSYRGRSIWHLWPDYFLLPIAGVAFGTCCLLQAMLSHFWTDQLVYLVSAKPLRAPISVRVVSEQLQATQLSNCSRSRCETAENLYETRSTN